MFDIGFFELLLIAVVGLVVIGPQRLPETIRTVGLWVGRIKRGLGSARQEFEKEFGVDEIRRQLHNEDIMRQFGETKETITNLDKARSTQSSDNASLNHTGDGKSSGTDSQPAAGKPSDEKPNV